MDELLVIIGAELILLVSVVAMMVHGRRTDVLSGRFFDQTSRSVPWARTFRRLQRWIGRGQERRGARRGARAALAAALEAERAQRPTPPRDQQGQPEHGTPPSARETNEQAGRPVEQETPIAAQIAGRN